MDMKDIGHQLRMARKVVSGIDKMAEKTGLHKNTILDIELGRKHYTTASLQKYLNYINYDIYFSSRG